VEVIANLLRAGVAAELVVQVADAITAARAEGAEEALRAMRFGNAERSQSAARTRRYRQRSGISQSEWLSIARYILRRDPAVCRYCGANNVGLAVDHIVPVSRGGTHSPDNLGLACKPCNSGKKDLLLSEWQGGKYDH
jgi:hypothetical protein